MSSLSSPVCNSCGARLHEPIASRCPFCKHRQAGPTGPIRWAQAFVRLLPWIAAFLAGSLLACTLNQFERSLNDHAHHPAEERRLLEEQYPERRPAVDRATPRSRVRGRTDGLTAEGCAGTANAFLCANNGIDSRRYDFPKALISHGALRGLDNPSLVIRVEDSARVPSFGTLPFHSPSAKPSLPCRPSGATKAQSPMNAT